MSDRELENARRRLIRALSTIAQSMSDDKTKVNAEFASSSGMSPKIVRKTSGKCCEWCTGLAGQHDYPAKKEVYQRHDNCDCTVEYVVGKKKQNVHSKKTIYEAGKNDVTEKRKMINDIIEDVTEKYFRIATPGIGNIEFDEDITDYDRGMTEFLFDIFGGDIHCLEERSDESKRPDALWNGHFWEYKAPSTENAIKDRIKSARAQIASRLKFENRDNNEQRGIVLDISNRKVSQEVMLRKIFREANQQCHHPTDIIIVENDNVVQIIRVHK